MNNFYLLQIIVFQKPQDQPPKPEFQLINFLMNLRGRENVVVDGL